MAFADAVERLLVAEGGYTNDPDDRGGETNYGISKRSYPDLDIKSLTRVQAIEIYRRDWWDKYGYDRLSYESLGDKVFSLAVNMGATWAHTLLQAALKDLGVDLEVDGRFGPETVQKANTYRHPDVLVMVMKCGVVAYYRSLRQPRFLAGWVRRAMA